MLLKPVYIAIVLISLISVLAVTTANIHKVRLSMTDGDYLRNEIGTVYIDAASPGGITKLEYMLQNEYTGEYYDFSTHRWTEESVSATIPTNNERTMYKGISLPRDLEEETFYVLYATLTTTSVLNEGTILEDSARFRILGDTTVSIEKGPEDDQCCNGLATKLAELRKELEERDRILKDGIIDTVPEPPACVVPFAKIGESCNDVCARYDAICMSAIYQSTKYGLFVSGDRYTSYYATCDVVLPEFDQDDEYIYLQCLCC